MTKAKPLSAANTPSSLNINRQPGEEHRENRGIDPNLADKLAELDRTDPIDAVIAGVPVSFTPVDEAYRKDAFAASMNLPYGTTPEGMELVDSWKDHVPEDFDPATHVPMHERTDQPIEETHATNPYLLESSTVLGDFHSEAQRAQLLINQIDHEIEHLTQDADYQIQRIVIRRDAELATREKRKADLMKIVEAASMIGGKEQSND